MNALRKSKIKQIFFVFSLNLHFLMNKTPNLFSKNWVKSFSFGYLSSVKKIFSSTYAWKS
jgi:hypothetical protein